MYLFYADESGDSGVKGTPFFVVSGIIIHESDVNETFGRVMQLRQVLHRTYKLPHRVYLHATDIVNGHGPFHHSQYNLSSVDRFNIYRDILQFVSQLNTIKILNVFVQKDKITTPIDIFNQAWTLFIQRCHNFLEKNAPPHNNEYGMLLTDRTQDDKLRYLMRRLRAFNMVPSQYDPTPRKILVTRMLEDPIPRSSQHSYFIQLADLVAFALARRDYRRVALDGYQFNTFFDTLDPVLLKQASRNDAQGIVYWPK